MSVKRNFFYSSLITVSGYLFPLITYPYVSRVLGVSNIGICNFVDNLVNYFILVAMMGTSVVGIREIAASQGNKIKLSRTFSSVLTLNAVSTAVAILALLIAMYTVSSLFPYRDLLYVGVCKLVFNLFLVEWFFTGIEDFPYITKRTILIRFLYVVAIFVFIHSREDYKWYYILTVGSTVLNACVNIIYSRRFVEFRIKYVNFKPYLKTFFVMGIYLLITNVYQSLNTVWLGLVTNTVEVGYFTTATKLHTIIMAIFSAFSNVMFPRVSNLLAKGDVEEFWHKINQAVQVIIAVATPTIILSAVFGPDILHLLSGNGYEGSYTPFRIISPLVMIIGFSQIFVIQILMASKQENVVLRNSIVGALVCVVLNMLFTKQLEAVGSAMVWLASEFSVMMLSLFAVRKKYHYKFPIRELIKYFVAYTPLIIILVAILLLIQLPDIFMLIIASAVTGLYAIIIEECYLKNEFVLQFINKILRRK